MSIDIKVLFVGLYLSFTPKIWILNLLNTKVQYETRTEVIASLQLEHGYDLYFMNGNQK